ncbi:alanine--tRNA ligase-related protein, partial [Holdemanella biformis]
MTIKLYEQEGYQTAFHAHVVSCVKKNELYDIILDQTLFFPEEGGQTCDKGTLNGIEVVDVQIINDEIHHFLHFPAPKVARTQ